MEIVFKTCVLCVLALEVLPVASGIIPRSALRLIAASGFFARGPLETYKSSLVPAKYENSVLRKSTKEASPIIVFLRKHGVKKQKKMNLVKTEKKWQGKNHVLDKLVGKLKSGGLWNKYPLRIGSTVAYEFSDLVI